jgi:flavin reductase (DIM6/NTAB) family NADH-FMN oxidoreductase RutF
MTKQFFNAADLALVDAHKFAFGLIVPRPIGWIGSMDTSGVHNLAPFSFFNSVTGYPPTVLFSPGIRDGRQKDTLANVEATGVFTVNIVSAVLGSAMNETAATAARDVDEFALADVTAAPGPVLGAPMVAKAQPTWSVE